MGGESCPNHLGVGPPITSSMPFAQLEGNDEKHEGYEDGDVSLEGTPYVDWVAIFFDYHPESEQSLAGRITSEPILQTEDEKRHEPEAVGLSFRCRSRDDHQQQQEKNGLQYRYFDR